MTTIEAVRIFQVLSSIKINAVTDKNNRFGLLDVVLALSPVYENYCTAERKSGENISDEKERNEYMERIATAKCPVDVPTISKDALYELAEGNKDTLSMGAFAFLAKLIRIE